MAYTVGRDDWIDLPRRCLNFCTRSCTTANATDAQEHKFFSFFFAKKKALLSSHAYKRIKEQR